MTKTPRTDDAYEMGLLDITPLALSFARKLEQELTEARAKIAELEHARVTPSKVEISGNTDLSFPPDHRSATLWHDWYYSFSKAEMMVLINADAVNDLYDAWLENSTPEQQISRSAI